MIKNALEMSWNEPGGGGNNDSNNPWNKKRKESGPPDLDQIFRKLQNNLKGLFKQGAYKSGDGFGVSSLKEFKLLGVYIIGFLLFIYIISGIFIVDPQERAAITRFGKYIRTVGPGPHWIPLFIESKELVNVEQVSTKDHSGLMLTRDRNIASVGIAVQYRIGDDINDVPAFLFNVVNPIHSLKQSAESALRQVVGQSTMDEVLTLKRSEIATAIKEQLVETLKNYHTGIKVIDVTMQFAKAPDEVGAHIVSGAVFDPKALNELIPNWKTEGAPLNTPVADDHFLFLTKKHSIPLPSPYLMKNPGNYIISLANLCRWLSKYAENLGVDIFSGFAASEILFNSRDQVIGVATNEVGVDRKGQKKSNYQPGVELLAQYTLFAEGCRGSLTKVLNEKFQLSKEACSQTYALGIKEIWEIHPSKHRLGSVIHTIGWPLDSHTYGGSFIYHFEANQLSIGLIIGLDYQNCHLDPFKAFQTFKQHPFVRPLLEGGRRTSYGAKALNEGGFQSIPKLIFPGGLLIGCAAGFLNVPRMKGSHTAMKSGILAANTVFEGICNQTGPLLLSYETSFNSSWIYDELKKARNIRPAFQYGLWLGLLYATLDMYLFRGKAPWTFRHKKPDNLSFKKIQDCKPIYYSKPDGVITFDKLSSVQLTNTFHAEDQRAHLLLKDPKIPITYNLPLYGAPEQHYCPAQVYEILFDDHQNPRLQMNASNCIHCKTCDIKDPTQNITWVPPEGGGGPNYTNM